MSSTDVRVRIAPSPTGTLHVGTARTALFNYLFAKHNNGKMVLRIEDTDLKRSSAEYIENILKGLKWLGIEYDEGPDKGGPYAPYVQTERMDIYQKYLKLLEDKGAVYPCFCTDEELENERKESEKDGTVYKYSGKCKKLTQDQRQAAINGGKSYTLRFNVPQKILVVKDFIRGDVSFDTALIGDFVVKKSDGNPTYNFAVVIDDIDMKITHIIRGDDIFSNTPKQILIYEALGNEIPDFAHISMILAKDRSKLSKRHGATSIEEYREIGYLKEALLNYLAMLGWSPSSSKEFFSLKELAEIFTLDRVAKSPAIFDIDKLNWLNSYYMKNLPNDKLQEHLMPYFTKAGISLQNMEPQKLKELINILKDRINVLSEAPKEIAYIFNEPSYSDDVVKNLKSDQSVEILKEVFDALTLIDTWEEKVIHDSLAALIKEKGIKTKLLLQTTRSALTGSESGADLPKVIYILNKEDVLKRIKNFILINN